MGGDLCRFHKILILLNVEETEKSACSCLSEYSKQA